MTGKRLCAISLMAAALAVLPACGNTKAGTAAAADTAVAMADNAMPLPEVPDSIFDPMDRADYVILHYWDALPPDDARMGDKDFMDASFARYAAQFQYASDYGISYAVTTLLQQMRNYPAAYKRFAELARKHFYRRGSESFCERAFIVWMKEALGSGVLDDGDTQRYEYLLAAAEKNSPGRAAADFRFTDRNGTARSLYSLPKAQYTLLVFYDPDCDTCHDIISRVRNDKQLMGPVNSGRVRVLLIDVAEDREAFAADAATMPSRWTVGFDESRVEDNDIYIFDNTPAIYLLDASYKVLLKDATVDELTEYAQSVTG